MSKKAPKKRVGGKRPGAGRPPEPDAFDATLAVRVRGDLLAQARSLDSGGEVAALVRGALADFVAQKST